MKFKKDNKHYCDLFENFYSHPIKKENFGFQNSYKEINLNYSTIMLIY